MLDSAARQIIEETALAEIEHFAAWGDPAAIERLAEAGRCSEWSSDEGGGATLFFTFPAAGRGRSDPGFLHPEHFSLAFDGEDGWFEIEKVSAKPWPYWRAVREVDTPSQGRLAGAVQR